MVKVYQSMYDENLNSIQGRTKLFIKDVLEDGSIGNHEHGIAVSASETGTMFIIDDWVIDQRDKLLFKEGALSVKDGEELIPPVKTEKELQREALLKQLAELDSQPAE